MNRYQSKMNFAAKTKARSFATMGAGFVDQIETRKMEERLQLMKKTMELEREERKNRGGQFWKSGQKGKLTTYANTVLQSRLSNKKVGKVKMLTDEQLNLPNRNEALSLSKKLSDISNTSLDAFKTSTRNNAKLCGQCESNEAALCCIQCTEVYCTDCFSAYHKKGALRKHRSISLEVSSTPRSKVPNFDKRLFDLNLTPVAADMKLQSDAKSSSGASGHLKMDEEEAAASSLMDGNYNEAESAACFQEALQAWRTNNRSSGAAGAAAHASIGFGTSGSYAAEISSSQPKPTNNEGVYTNSSTSTTAVTAGLASLMDNTQSHTLSYAERLLVKKNRRIPITWEQEPLNTTEPSERKDNSEQMKTLGTEESSSVLNSSKLSERLNIDEPVTFSSLYHLVAEDVAESVQLNTLKSQFSPTPKETMQNELTLKPEVSTTPAENSISVVPLVQSFPKKDSTSSASLSDEKRRTKKESERKTPTHQTQTLKKQRPKSRPSSSVSRGTNLTTTPSEGLQMVSQLTKSQHSHNDRQQPSLLMAGLSGDATGDMDEINSLERNSLFKNNPGVTRPATTVKVSYSLYKMSPCSWRPERSISQNLSDNQFHLIDSLSDRTGLGVNDTQSNLALVGAETVSAFDSPLNTVKATSSVGEESAMMGSAQEDRPTNESLAAKSASHQSPEVSARTLEDVRDSPLMTRESARALACLNNNAILPRHTEKYDPTSPNSVAEDPFESRSPTPTHSIISSRRNKTATPHLMTDSATPVNSPRRIGRSGTMSPITTMRATNKDHPGIRIYSARDTSRNTIMFPDFATEKPNESFSSPVHSVKHSPRNKNVSPIPVERNSEENTISALSLRASTTSVHSSKYVQRDNIVSPSPTSIDVPGNLYDAPAFSITNRSDATFSFPTTIEKQHNRSATPALSIKSTARSKTSSSFHKLEDTEEKRCDTPEYPMKGTPRCESTSPIPTVRQTHRGSTDTAVPNLANIDTEENVSGTLLHSPKRQPRSKSASPISNVPEHLCETPAHSLSSSPSCKTALSIATMIEIRESGSANSISPIKDTPRNKTESPIPTIIDAQESISDTPVHSAINTPTSSVPTIDPQESASNTPVPSVMSIAMTSVPQTTDIQECISDTLVPSVRNTPTSPVPTLVEKQQSRSVTPVSSTRDTSTTQISEVTTASSQAKSSPTNNREDEDKSEIFQYNATIYQMLVDKELVSYTPDLSDDIIPLLPTATEQNESIIDPEERSPTLCPEFIAKSTETEVTSNDCMPVSSRNTTLLSTSVPLSYSSESVTPVFSEGKLSLNDKLATTFYMCNSELYNTENSLQGSETLPLCSEAKLKKGSASTKKYIIPRPPEIPDGTKLKKSNPSRDDNLQSKSVSPLRVLEMKRINFKQSNNDQNVISHEEKPNSEKINIVPDLSKLSQLSGAEKMNDSEDEDDHESVFSSLTKMSVDSLDEEPSESMLFNEEEFGIEDDLQAEIDEIEEQIAEEMKKR